MTPFKAMIESYTIYIIHYLQKILISAPPEPSYFHSDNPRSWHYQLMFTLDHFDGIFYLIIQVKLYDQAS